MSLKTKKRSGFTLIELLVVVAIIGILSSIGVVIYLEQQKSSRDARRKSDLALISGALQNYFAVNKMYPRGRQDNTITTDKTLVYNCYFFSDGGRAGRAPNCSTQKGTLDYQKDWIMPLQSGGYISVIPKDPIQEDLGDLTSSTVYDQYVNNNTSVEPQRYFYVYTARTGGQKDIPDVPDPLAYKYFYLMTLLENKTDPERFELVKNTLNFNNIEFDWYNGLYVISSR